MKGQPNNNRGTQLSSNRGLSPRNANFSFATGSNNPRLLHIVICFGVLLITLQLGYNVQNNAAKEDTLSFLGRGAIAVYDDESSDTPPAESNNESQLKKQLDQMAKDMSKLRKDLEKANNGNNQVSSTSDTKALLDLKAEIKALKKQVSKDTPGTSSTKHDDDAHAEMKKELEALKQQLSDAKVQSSERMLVGSNKNKDPTEIEASKQQMEQLQENDISQQSTTEGSVKEIAPEDDIKVKYPYAKPPVASEFTRQEGVVVATKIHGPHQFPILKQFLCLFNFAYNKRMKYDVLIFTTEPLSKEEIEEIQMIGKPAKVFVVVDNAGLHKLIDELEPHKREMFLEKCDLKDPEALANATWFNNCKERGRTNRLAYNWQAEFRAMRIWTHKALKPYRYMLWIDADAFCTEEWKRDPVAFFIENNLAIFFANFAAGKSPGGFPEFKSRLITAFNRTLSEVEIEEGHLTAKDGVGAINQIHGFMHMTDLDFFRSEQVLHWARTLIGDEFLSRRFDDQLAVTVPAAILAPNRSWLMRQNGVELNVFHNGLMDGQERAPAFNFLAYWNDKGGKEKMPEANEKCELTANG